MLKSTESTLFLSHQNRMEQLRFLINQRFKPPLQKGSIALQTIIYLAYMHYKLTGKMKNAEDLVNYFFPEVYYEKVIRLFQKSINNR